MLTTLKWRGEVAVTRTGENNTVHRLLLRDVRGGEAATFRDVVSWVSIIHFLGGLA